jgi:Zn-dependent M28 family amino/carboxypeptidase
LFIAFTGEELGLLGSKSFAAGLNHDLVKAVVNIEMIGRKRGKSGNPYFTGADQSNLFEIMNRRLRKSDPSTYKKPYFIKDYFGSEKLFERSDNYSFAGYGIPAHTIMLTSPTDKYYHSLSDEASTLDFEIMSKIINAIAIASKGLINGEDTPTRINLQ